MGISKEQCISIPKEQCTGIPKEQCMKIQTSLISNTDILKPLEQCDASTTRQWLKQKSSLTPNVTFQLNDQFLGSQLQGGNLQ